MCRAAAASVGGIDVKRWEDVIQARREVAARGIQDCLKRLRQDLQRLVPADAAQMMSRVTNTIRRMLKVEQWDCREIQANELIGLADDNLEDVYASLIERLEKVNSFSFYTFALSESLGRKLAYVQFCR